MTCAGVSEADGTLRAEIGYLLSLLLQWKDCKEELGAISPNQLLLQACLQRMHEVLDFLETCSKLASPALEGVLMQRFLREMLQGLLHRQ